MTDLQFADLMTCLGFGLGSIFWSFVYYVLMSGRK